VSAIFELCIYIYIYIYIYMSVSNAWVCGPSLAGTAGSNPAGGHGCLYSLSVVCCQAEVSLSG